MVDLSLELAGIKLKNPVMVASGTFGYGKEYADYIKLNKLGAIVTKSITLNKRAGNPPPRIVETPSGMLNSIGLQNEGLQIFIEEALPFLQTFKVPVIANIAGETRKEFIELARTLSKQAKIKALEINISCPNVERGGMQFGCAPEGTEEVVRAVREVTSLPIIVKLSPNVTDIRVIALKAEQAGADALSLINTIVGMSIDTNTWQPRLGRATGGLSGPAIRPIAVRMVYEVAQVVKIPVIGIGGITSTRDAIEFFLAGASAVQIGTGNFIDPETTIKIIAGLESYLQAKNLQSIKDIIKKIKE